MHLNRFSLLWCMLLSCLGFVGCADLGSETPLEVYVEVIDELSYEEFEAYRSQVVARYQLQDAPIFSSEDFHDIETLDLSEWARGVEGEYPQFPTLGYAKYLHDQNPALTGDQIQQQVREKINELDSEKWTILGLKLKREGNHVAHQQRQHTNHYDEEIHVGKHFFNEDWSRLLKYKKILEDLRDAKDKAIALSEQYRPIDENNGTRRDAFRHIMSCILMAKAVEPYFLYDTPNPQEVGSAQFCQRIMTAHELGAARVFHEGGVNGDPGNPACDTAMDLHNNAIGFQIYSKYLTFKEHREWEYTIFGKTFHSKLRHQATSPDTESFAERVNSVINESIRLENLCTDSPSVVELDQIWESYKKDEILFWVTKAEDYPTKYRVDAVHPKLFIASRYRKHAIYYSP